MFDPHVEETQNADCITCFRKLIAVIYDEVRESAGEGIPSSSPAYLFLSTIRDNREVTLAAAATVTSANKWAINIETLSEDCGLSVSGGFYLRSLLIGALSAAPYPLESLVEALARLVSIAHKLGSPQQDDLDEEQIVEALSAYPQLITVMLLHLSGLFGQK